VERTWKRHAFEWSKETDELRSRIKTLEAAKCSESAQDDALDFSRVDATFNLLEMARSGLHAAAFNQHTALMDGLHDHASVDKICNRQVGMELSESADVPEIQRGQRARTQRSAAPTSASAPAVATTAQLEKERDDLRQQVQLLRSSLEKLCQKDQPNVEAAGTSDDETQTKLQAKMAEHAAAVASHDKTEMVLQGKIAELQSEIEIWKLEASMNLFYAIIKPEKLVDVPKLARTFVNQDDKKLSSEMRKNYNGLDLSSNLETLLKEAKKGEKELVGLKEQLKEERGQRELSEKSLRAKDEELAGVREYLKRLEKTEMGLQGKIAELRSEAKRSPMLPVQSDPQGIAHQLGCFYASFNPERKAEAEEIWSALVSKHGGNALSELNRQLRDRYGCDLTSNHPRDVRQPSTGFKNLLQEKANRKKLESPDKCQGQESPSASSRGQKYPLRPESPVTRVTPMVSKSGGRANSGGRGRSVESD
jgi:hypothetical protein